MKIYFINYDSEGMTPKEEGRKQHVLGRRLLRLALIREGISIEVPLENNDSQIFYYGPSGKPFLRERPDIHFNISHTKGLVVCAIGTHVVGVDAEQIRPYPGSVLRKMTEKERFYIQHATNADEAFMRVWTMKEAVIKWTGEGLAAFSKTECIPGHMPDDQRFRQMVWQGRYVITAVEN